MPRALWLQWAARTLRNQSAAGTPARRRPAARRAVLHSGQQAGAELACPAEENLEVAGQNGARARGIAVVKGPQVLSQRVLHSAAASTNGRKRTTWSGERIARVYQILDETGYAVRWRLMTRGLAGNKPVSEGAELKNRRAALVLVAVEKRGKGSGRVRMKVIPDFKAITIISFLTQNVTPGSTIYTDGLKSFAGLSEAGFKHVARTQPLRQSCAKVRSPR